MGYFTPENVQLGLNIVIMLAPAWIPLMMKWRDSLSARSKAILDLGVMGFNSVQRWKKFTPKEARSYLETNAKAIEKATDLYFDQVGPKTNIGKMIGDITGSNNKTIMSIVGEMERLHTTNKLTNPSAVVVEKEKKTK